MLLLIHQHKHKAYIFSEGKPADVRQNSVQLIFFHGPQQLKTYPISVDRVVKHLWKNNKLCAPIVTGGCTVDLQCDVLPSCLYYSLMFALAFVLYYSFSDLTVSDLLYMRCPLALFISIQLWGIIKTNRGDAF